jgi:choline/glycine/proline betaine transport protein
LMCYSIYLGLKREHEILESSTYAERMEEFNEQDELEHIPSRQNIISKLTRDDSTVSDD